MFRSSLEVPTVRNSRLLRALIDGVKNCSAELTELEKKLDPGKARKAMSRFGIRSLKMPFKNKEVEDILKNLQRCRATVLMCLNIDKAYVSALPLFFRTILTMSL